VRVRGRSRRAPGRMRRAAATATWARKARYGSCRWSCSRRRRRRRRAPLPHAPGVLCARALHISLCAALYHVRCLAVLTTQHLSSRQAGMQAAGTSQRLEARVGCAAASQWTAKCAPPYSPNARRREAGAGAEAAAPDAAQTAAPADPPGAGEPATGAPGEEAGSLPGVADGVARGGSHPDGGIPDHGRSAAADSGPRGGGAPGLSNGTAVLGGAAASGGGANGLRPDANGHMADYADAPKRRRL
jgi:hypothetical protein